MLDMCFKPIFCTKAPNAKSCRAQSGQALMMADQRGSVVVRLTVRVRVRENRIQEVRVRREVRV